MNCIYAKRYLNESSAMDQQDMLDLLDAFLNAKQLYLVMIESRIDRRSNILLIRYQGHHSPCAIVFPDGTAVSDLKLMQRLGEYADPDREIIKIIPVLPWKLVMALYQKESVPGITLNIERASIIIGHNEVKTMAIVAEHEHARQIKQKQSKQKKEQQKEIKQKKEKRRV